MPQKKQYNINKLATRYKLAGVLLVLNGCALVEQPPQPQNSTPQASVSIQNSVEIERGSASFYAAKFAGRSTASGERYNPHAKTAAHKTLPFGTYVQVENLSNHKKVVVRINDRGPFAKGRVIDLSMQAAHELGMVSGGVSKVALSVACATNGECQEYAR